MPYMPPPQLQFNPVNFGSMAPGGLDPKMMAVLGQNLKGLMGPGQPGPAAPGAPDQSGPPQMGMLSGLMQKLGMSGGAAPSPMGGGMGAMGGPMGGISPTALTGLW